MTSSKFQTKNIQHTKTAEEQLLNRTIRKDNTAKKQKKSSDGKMFYLIGKRILKEQKKAYHKRHAMDINTAHDLFNYMSEQVLRQTCKERKIKLMGQLKPCPGRLFAKAKRKRIIKTSNVRASKTGERLFTDTSGPYPRSIGGSIYWFKVVDNCSRKNWNFLMKNKTKVQYHLVSRIKESRSTT